MGLENKARELSECMHAVMTETHRHDKKLMAVFNTLAPQEFHVMMTVGHTGGCIMSDIAGAVQLSLSSITGIVDKLEAKGIAKRDRSVEDRRIVRVVLTGEGRKVYKTAMDGHLEFVRNLLKTLEPHEQDMLLPLFRKISGVIKSRKGKG